jgi:hypothetical protein
MESRSLLNTWILTLSRMARVCDENGVDILSDTPPPRGSGNGPGDWTPYKSRLEFEIADFLFRRNQMSAGDINLLFGLYHQANHEGTSDLGSV